MNLNKCAAARRPSNMPQRRGTNGGVARKSDATAVAMNESKRKRRTSQVERKADGICQKITVIYLYTIQMWQGSAYYICMYKDSATTQR